MKRPSKTELLKTFKYDPKTGDFYRKGRLQNTITRGGYIRIYYKGAFYPAHKLAWLVNYGEYPEFPLDHINRNKEDNRIENLRPTTPQENRFNSNLNKNNSSGFMGVSWNSQLSKWKSSIVFNRKEYHLGYFAEKWEANVKRLTALELLLDEGLKFDTSKALLEAIDKRLTRSNGKV